MKLGLSLWLVCAFQVSLVHALDLEKAVAALEASGDQEIAEPVAFKLSQERKHLYYYTEFLRKYPASEFAEVVYEQSWRDVKESQNTTKLSSFVKVRPGGPYSLEALDKLLALYQQENSLLGYQTFLKDFPNSPQAVKALEGIYQLAFARAQEHAEKLKSVEIYDEYIRAFPHSPYLKEVSKKAEELEARTIRELLSSFHLGNLFSNRQQQKETVARKLYNEMREAHTAQHWPISQRKRNLLMTDLFIDTTVRTEVLDRDEELAFRQAVLKYQTESTQQLDSLQRLYQEESARIVAAVKRQGELMRAAVERQGEQTQQAIAQQGQQTHQDLQGLASSIAGLSYEKGRLADAVNDQTSRMVEEARSANQQQARLYAQAEERSQREARHSRECAENLAKNGRYTWFSGCP